mgnify:CR=1 FL=1
MEIDFRKKRYVLDGGMGTMLQSAGMSPEETTTEFGLAHPEILTQIHKKYIEAGADIVYASTFGTNRFKKKEIGECTLQEAVRIQVKAAVKAKEIMAAQGREVAVAIDLGPLGELLEPMGTLSFEDAYDAFREVIQAGCDLADLIETGAMPAMNHYSGVQYTSVPELKEYIQKADLITLQIGANDALIRTIVALGEATNWKSEKLANSMVTGMFRNLTPDNIDYFMDCLKQLTLTPSEFRAVMHLLTTGMNQICTSTYADTVSQVERVMKDLRELNPDAQIMVLSYNNPVPLMPSWSRHFRRLNTAVAKLAAQYDVTYVPIPYTRTANDGHPTVSGHKYIGRQILKAVNY